jgi:hypothetical protein
MATLFLPPKPGKCPINAELSARNRSPHAMINLPVRREYDRSEGSCPNHESTSKDGLQPQVRQFETALEG